MKTTKAYLAGSGIVAVDGLPDLGRAPAPLERVVLKEGGQGAKDSDRTRLATRRQARRADRRSPARRLRISRDRAPRGGRRGALREPGAPGGSPLPPPVDDTVAGVTDTLGGAVEGTTGVVGGTLGNVAPGVGAPLTEIGSRLGETIRGLGTG